MRELIAPIVRAIASARSDARFVQNSASAARVGTDRAKSTCGSEAATNGVSVVPTTHTSLATHAVGNDGSSPGASTRPDPPGITDPVRPSWTANIRSTTSPARICEPSNNGVVASRGRSRSSCGSRSSTPAR